MKKVAIVFVLAVLVPSLVLAWLASRSLRDQQFVLERQQSLLYQGVTDNLAREAQSILEEELRGFGLEVEAMLLRQDASGLARTFDERLRARWPWAEVGFAVTTNGVVLSPVVSAGPTAREFLANNNAFLGNKEAAEVYWNVAKQQTGVQQSVEPSPQQAAPNEIAWNSSQAVLQKAFPSKGAQTRNVLPQQSPQSFGANDALVAPPGDNRSRINPAEAEFRQLIGEATQGTVARFVDNRLTVLFWCRTERAPGLVFGAQVSLARLKADLEELFDELTPPVREEVCAALLDDSARPVALSHPGFQANWKRPFVATEISEALPHWEVAAYLLNPDALKQTAFTIRISLGLLIAVLLIAMIVGSWLIVNDLNRQMTLARQKTDFVSNVSHELKTPLTSIRMFSELLAEGRVGDPAKQRSYLHIITAEAARLTRLINNVLDFARLERGEKKYNFQDCDLVSVVRETAESYRPHLENHGFSFRCQLLDAPVPVRGDTDALAQILVNLLSNAEKYSGEHRQIEIEMLRHDTPLPYAEVRVLDRGLGVPAGCEEKIFENFYRAHDSLASGIQGSGLGLTLARQMARAHGGDVAYSPREGGGSCFALRLPLVGQASRLSPP